MLKTPASIPIPAKGSIAIFRNADAMGMVYYKRSDGSISPAEYIHGIYRIPVTTFNNYIDFTDEKLEKLKFDSRELLFDLRKANIIQYRSGGGGSSSGGSSSSGNWTVISESGIIAFAAGGQVGATEMETQESGASYNRVDTATSPDSSVKPDSAALENMYMSVLNRSTNTIDVYPFLGDRFLAVDGTLMAVNAPFEVAPENQLAWFVYEDGIMTIQ